MSSVAGAETAGTSSAATSATTPSARPASRETSAGRNSQISSTLVSFCRLGYHATFSICVDVKLNGRTTHHVYLKKLA